MFEWDEAKSQDNLEKQGSTSDMQRGFSKEAIYWNTRTGVAIMASAVSSRLEKSKVKSCSKRFVANSGSHRPSSLDSSASARALFSVMCVCASRPPAFSLITLASVAAQPLINL